MSLAVFFWFSDEEEQLMPFGDLQNLKFPAKVYAALLRLYVDFVHSPLHHLLSVLSATLCQRGQCRSDCAFQNRCQSL